jgi:Anti-sigma-28 factor, FlgM
MIEDRETLVQELRELVRSGEYRVHPGAVADALLRRSSGQDLAREYAELTPGTGRVATLAGDNRPSTATVGPGGTTALAA